MVYKKNNDIGKGCAFFAPWPDLLVVTALLILIGCPSVPAQPNPGPAGPSAAPPPQRVAGIAVEMLRKAGLQARWVGSVPLERDGVVSRIFYRGGRLFALTDTNTLFALDAKSGLIQWSAVVGSPHIICSPENFFEENLLYMVGNTFVQIRLADGKITQQMNVHFPVSTSAARTKDRIFLGGYDKKFYCLRASDGITLWQTLCPAEPTGTVTVSGDKVYFVCKDYTLYISKTDERSLVWKVPTAGDVPGVAVAEDLCYLPSADTALYCIAPESQKLVWKHLTGGSLVEPPVLTAGAIYQPLKHAALLCLNRNDGSPRWQLADGHNLLAENGTLSYVFTLDRELAIMNNLTGKRELSFYLPSLQLFASNTEDPSIFLAGREGTILVLMPAQIETK